MFLSPAHDYGLIISKENKINDFDFYQIKTLKLSLEVKEEKFFAGHGTTF